ncbi:MAG TPA: hypothetical protein VLC52_12040, partial [Anaerolineae bacterium]|nr:hypothetical protein [Anaerolineae bacterium]
MRRATLACWKRSFAIATSLLLLAGVFSLTGGGMPQLAAQSSYAAFLPLVSGAPGWTDCSQSAMGSTLMFLPEFDDSTGPELARLAADGYVGLTASPTRETALEYFPLLDGWDRVQICNSLECVQSRAELAAGGEPPYEILGYDPERLGGVPDEEKYNLPWATESARAIADEWGQPLIISYSTEQLHLEAEERGFGWDNPGAVVELLAPYGDLWLIQAADEYNDPYYNPDNPEPILSQRHFPPGPEWRAEAEKWVTWIRSANPEIEIWIQLALHRIPAGAPPWEDDYPSAELALEYREWLVNPQYGPPLVDGVFLSSVYSWPIDSVVADAELERAFRLACDPVPPDQSGDAQIKDPPVVEEQGGDAQMEDPPVVEEQAGDERPADPLAPAQDGISLVEEGWTDDLVVAGITVLPGYYYRLYENSSYPCGTEGNHQFMVLDSSPDAGVEKHLFVKFLGGAVGFWYLDSGGNRVYYPQENAVGLLTEALNYNWMFRTSVSEEYADGVTKKIRENSQFRILVPSYCSHDFYHGSGECDATDGFCRSGYLAAMEAVDHVQANLATKKLITYGGSAGAAGFYVGKDQDNVAGIIMDSQAVDMTAISDACYAGTDAFGGSFPCFCPAGGPSCMEVLAPRIGFELGQDEPHHFVERGEVGPPIYLIWNAHDASADAHYQYDNLHQALKQYNPGGQSVACRVCLPHADPEVPDTCIQDDNYEPLGTCNLHVP